MRQYFDGFKDEKSITSEFRIPESSLHGCVVKFAEYDLSEAYSGSAFIIYEKDGVLFENHGRHCSCYGLEGQWLPEVTSWEAIAMRHEVKNPYRDAQKFLARLCKRNLNKTKAR